ncbi:MAG: aldehyde dehydrogenase family protein [Acidobacteria bacterium]|nr:aldehyde dehydrogenase family protein [Acidobacteriota bacterium]
MADVATQAQRIEKGLLIAGKWESGADRLEVRSPYDGSLVGTTYNASAEAMERAIAETVRAAAIMREVPAFQRAQILRGISAGVEKRKEELARVLSAEAGKPIKVSRLEVERAAFTFGVAAEEATRQGGEVLPLDLLPATVGRFAMLRRFPLGPIAAITPFNFPCNLVAHKLAPAIAAGCSLLLKPAPQTPFSALLLAEISLGAGLPPGAFNVVPCLNEVAEKFVADERIKLLTFTGSAAVGWALRAKAGKKRVALELGGNAGCIIHKDANLDYAAERCVFGGFSYAGQSCISVQRILVHRDVYEKFLESFVPRVKKLKLGDPSDDATDVGPVIRASDADRIIAWISEAKAAGATVLAGGGRTGSVVEPTVLANTKRTMKVNCFEVFAPVVTVEPYDDFSAALTDVNDSPYGLQAGVFTRDAKLIFEAYNKLEVGGVIIGDVPTFRIDQMPYGGVKESGVGREGLRYAIEEMTEPKLLAFNIQ